MKVGIITVQSQANHYIVRFLYAITTILNYVIIAVGAMTVFGSLGVSWDKLQWLAAALSVGLG
ncbi:mechanosensitive ion channel, partial [Salmonella enterica subsp. enterica serovar Kentucky]|nr:mechanosensitive ion channel [Salmonella enterica subsp. enterica serovar Kentucky]